MSDQATIPPLRFPGLTRFYDRVLRVATRESRWRSRLLELVAPRPGQRILDLGCGTGTFLRLLRDSSAGLHLSGIDADGPALAVAARKLGPGSLVRLIHGDARRLPLEGAHFHCVSSSLFFHHLLPQDKLRCLAEVHRVLRPGGKFVVADWGKPLGPISRAAFLPVQWLDGFATTQDSVTGALPAMIAASGFGRLQEGEPLVTPVGVVRFWTARI